MTALKYALLGISFAGQWQNICKKTGMNVHFVPFFAVCLQITILFFAGLWNLLYEVSVLTWALGIGLFVWYAVKDKLKGLREFCTPGYALLIAGVLLAAVAVHGCKFTHYDNFTHWALVVKQMLLNDRFPNFQDVVISYKSYPLGSASFIYYVCRLTQNSESAQMLAQAYMVLTCILPLFAFLKQHYVLGTAMIALIGNIVLTYDVRITDLLVDSLLGAAGIALVLFAAMGFDPQDKEHCKGWRVLCAAPMMAALYLIKNAGLFFAAIAVVILVIRCRGSRAQMGRAASTLLLPLGAVLLWKRHCEYVFLNPNASPHSLSLEYYQEVSSQKTSQDIWKILENLLRKAGQGCGLWMLLLWIVVLGGITLLFGRKYFKKYLCFTGTAIALYAGWIAGLFGTYVYSMPTSEALVLAAFSRYQGTILVAILLWMGAYAAQLLSALGHPFELSLTGVLVLGALLCVNRWDGKYPNNIFITRDNRPGSQNIRFRLEQTIEEYEMQPGVRRVICYPSDDHRLFFYLGKYLLGDNNTICLTINEENVYVLEKGVQGDGAYENIVNYDPENEVLEQWIEENYPEQKGKEVIVQKVEEAEKE